MLAQQEHPEDMLLCLREMYKLGLCSTIVVENLHGVCMGMLEFLSGFAPLFSSKFSIYYTVFTYSIISDTILQIHLQMLDQRVRN